MTESSVAVRYLYTPHHGGGGAAATPEGGKSDALVYRRCAADAPRCVARPHRTCHACLLHSTLVLMFGPGAVIVHVSSNHAGARSGC